ncbi:MAG: methionyl-tRNA formyltransferase [Bacillota bacterium]
MRIVYMGTPDFAVPCLDILIKNKYDVCAVITQPDREKGRGKKLAPPPVKVLAESCNIPVYQPVKVKTPEFVEVLKQLAPDLIVVVAFGQILSKDILDIPAHGCINVHASLLPKYRGAAPINWSIINGEKLTGVTTMYMDVGLDTGDMILKRELEIGDNQTFIELYEELSYLGSQLLLDTIKLIERGTAPREKQNDSEASYAPMITKQLGRIDWSKDAVSIKNLVRGTQPWPGAYTAYEGKTFKVFECEVIDNTRKNDDFGHITEAGKYGLVISCGVGSVRIRELQFENEKRMSVEAYLRGHNINVGSRLV